VVANGDSVPCGGIARDIDIKIGQEIFNINAYSEVFHIAGLGAGRQDGVQAPPPSGSLASSPVNNSYLLRKSTRPTSFILPM
jgi:hypothetical protein